jgi:hypothetical protein
MTPEGKVKQTVRDILDAHAVYYYFPVAGLMSKAGIPDIIACCAGVFLAIECKAGKNKPTALQTLTLNGMRAAGGVAIVVNEHNMPALERLVANISKLTDSPLRGILQEQLAPFK